MICKKTWLLCVLSISFFFTACGGGVSGENGSDPFNSGNSAETSSNFKLGYFDENNQFIEGQIGVQATNNGINQVSAGGSVGLSVIIVNQDNQRVQAATTVTYSSACVTANKASVETSVSSVNGQANNTFIDQGCGGGSGIVDEITATIVINEQTITASTEVNILPDAIGSIRFVSASPQNITLAGSGDSSQTQTTVSFLVVNEQGLPLADQVVDFSLSSETGGVALSDLQGTSNDDGEVSVRLDAGSVPTIVRVNANVVSLSGEIISTQSDAIAITTGLANQYSFSLGSDLLNVEGLNQNGEEVNVTARLSDTFGNPVPDNTTINFTTEGGQIQPSCLTIDGACSVTWTSGNPRVDDGIVTILATSIGHETLFDNNGNNVYDIDDGNAIDDNSDSGIFVEHPTGTLGFIDISEAWRDDNDNGKWDAGEIFLDYNNNQSFDEADGLFNGLQCTHPTQCGRGSAATMHVRQATRLIISGSSAKISVNADNSTLVTNDQPETSIPVISVNREQNQEFSVIVGDINGNVMPVNTSITVTTSAGELEVLTGTIVPNTSVRSPSKLVFLLANNLAEDVPADIARINILVVTPSGRETNLRFNIELK